MDTAKYIVAEIVSGGVAMETPIIFPSFIAHSDIAQNLKVISAGFVQFTPDQEDRDCVDVEAFGESVSLNLKSRPKKDARLIAYSLGLA